MPSRNTTTKTFRRRCSELQCSLTIDMNNKLAAGRIDEAAVAAKRALLLDNVVAEADERRSNPALPNNDTSAAARLADLLAATRGKDEEMLHDLIAAADARRDDSEEALLAIVVHDWESAPGDRNTAQLLVTDCFDELGGLSNWLMAQQIIASMHVDTALEEQFVDMENDIVAVRAWMNGTPGAQPVDAATRLAAVTAYLHGESIKNIGNSAMLENICAMQRAVYKLIARTELVTASRTTNASTSTT